MELDAETMEAKLDLDPEIKRTLENSPKVQLARNEEELHAVSMPEGDDDWFEVAYEVEGEGEVVEARVCRAKNGIAANYPDPYMRRRDPDCMFIGDDLPTDKDRYSETWGEDFSQTRQETFDWLADRELLAFPFMAGQKQCGIPALAVVPANAGFFALGLGLLQGIMDLQEYEGTFSPKTYLYAAPPFRHTHFDGRQVVVHNRSQERHEIFSYNLYPGPSAKKGIYGALLHFGELEDWVTAHASVVRVRTPYNNKTTIMHEGASGGGKSEMNEHLHRTHDGSIFLGKNLVTDEEKNLTLPRVNKLMPVADDMVLCHKDLQKDNGKLGVLDAESGWFIRVDHIDKYGTDPDIEARAVTPEVPLEFFNIDAQPNSTALLWEHVEDEPGVPCPNPRFVMPRRIMPHIVDEPLQVDVRSFGVRTPPCTRDEPTYGILGMFHILPPALAWLWRLVSPRGHDNPSIVDTEGISSEGVGSYWPFATGKKVTQANLLLKQFQNSSRVLNVLCPVQHIGAWEVDFMSEWMMREFIPRRGNKLERDELKEARCNLLGYSLNKLVIEGQDIDDALLNVEAQQEVGKEAYDEGAQILTDFFREQIKQFLTDDLDPTGRKIIECCLDGGNLKDYEDLIDSPGVFTE